MDPQSSASGDGDLYDVFISHCGADCKRDFAVWLKTELERVGVRCFFDEHSLKVADNAEDRMLHAMQTAKYGVVILSMQFFEREWCMKELLTFVTRGNVIPIFYNSFEEVQAARKGAIDREVWKAFGRFNWTSEDYNKAAKGALVHTGVRLAEDGWWNSCIRKVRTTMLRLLDKVDGGLTISEDELFVAQNQHLQALKSLLGLPVVREAADLVGGAQEVGIVGVKGMGGVGKTTLAKKLHDEPDVRECFDGGVCWLEVGPQPSTLR